jgi:hypothetical protein
MSGAIPPLPQYAFMAWCLVKHRDNFTFTLVRFKIALFCIRTDGDANGFANLPKKEVTVTY